MSFDESSEAWSQAQAGGSDLSGAGRIDQWPGPIGWTNFSLSA